MPRTIYLETFGCQMNELDSELVAGSLHALGYRFTRLPDDADVILYNTCSVREHAEQKVWSRLGELAIRKARQPRLVVGVLGCLAERDGTDLVRRMPVVDILCGPGELDKLPTLLDNAVRVRASMFADRATESSGFADYSVPNGKGEPARARTSIPANTPEPRPAPIAWASERSAKQIALQGSSSRRSATLAAAEDSLELLDLSRAVSPIDGRPRHSAYVRVTRGCNKFCTYCVVPFTRGAEIHRPPDHIIDECKRLADSGVLEITLLGQTVNHYRFEHGAAVTLNGHTQPQKGRAYTGGHRRDPFSGASTTTFADLLARIHDQVPAIQRLRFVTSYPRDFGDDVLEVIRDHPRLCRYLHVPAQSGSDRILGLMNRGYTVAEYTDFLDRARAHLDQPELGKPLTISGDIIVGFPTETDEDFAASVALVRRARYKNCFIFKYSPRPGTTAFDKLEDDVPEHVKRRRNNELLAIQSTISNDLSRAQLGKTFDVLIEGLSHLERKKQRRAASAQAEGTCSSNGTVTLTVNGTPGHTSASAHASSACAIEDEVEQPATPAAVQLSGRTSTDLIVFLEAPAGRAPETLVGRIMPVTITSASALALYGTAASV